MKKFAILSLMAVLALGACDDDDDPTGNDNEAIVRVVNATTVATGGNNTYAAIDAFRGTGTGTQLGGTVQAGAQTVCSQTIEVPAGSQQLNFRTPGSTTNVAGAARTFNFTAGRRYTIIFYGTPTNPQSMVVEDLEGTATSGNRRVRFINATTNATAADIYARSTTATTFPTGTTATFTNVATGTAAGTGAAMYANIPTANTTFQIFNTGATTGTARASYTLNSSTIPASGTTIVFTDQGAYQINNCS